MELKELIEELEKLKGRHTELVSVYLPSGYDMAKALEFLESEKATARNIQSKTVRNHVIDALEKILLELRKLRGLPPNGVAIFCGYVGDELKFYMIEPPEPLRTKLYRCDKEFMVKPLKEMLEPKKVYGLLVLDTKNMAIGLLKGKAIITLKEMESIVPPKTHKGGMSQQRYKRVREGLIRDWYKKVASIARKLLKDTDGILIGGPAESYKAFVDEYLPSDLKEKIIAMKSVCYTNEYGLRELVDKCKEELKEEEVMKEKKLVEDFFQKLARGDELITYGYEEVKRALLNGAAEVVLVSEKVERDKRKEIEKLAKQTGASVNLISDQTHEGKQFVNYQVAAFLRFKL